MECPFDLGFSLGTFVIDALKGLLSDPEVLSEVSRTFIDANTIYLVTDYLVLWRALGAVPTWLR